MTYSPLRTSCKASRKKGLPGHERPNDTVVNSTMKKMHYNIGYILREPVTCNLVLGFGGIFRC